MCNLNYLKPEDLPELMVEDGWNNDIIEIKNIKKGDIFYECERGKNIKLIALEDAKKRHGGWRCMVKNCSGEKIELFISGKTSYNGARLFRTPKFLTEDKEKGSIYFIE